MSLEHCARRFGMDILISSFRAYTQIRNYSRRTSLVSLPFCVMEESLDRQEVCKKPSFALDYQGIIPSTLRSKGGSMLNMVATEFINCCRNH